MNCSGQMRIRFIWSNPEWRGCSLAAVSDLYRDGVGCGACYQSLILISDLFTCRNTHHDGLLNQVRCTSNDFCSDNGVTVVITDHGSSHNTDFILSRGTFGRLAQTAASAASLLSLGVVDIEYRRVSCTYPNKNITIKIDENSDYPYYLGFVIWYQQGRRDITAVQLCEAKNLACKLLDRSNGAVWTTNSPPSGPLLLRMLFSDEDGDERWVVPANNIPNDWKAGQTHDTGVQHIQRALKSVSEEICKRDSLLSVEITLKQPIPICLQK
ncbi:hypothetical protein DKX38_001122 [Salix brachista]|uniref:Expansin-like EG45 domain-containing protein n=1 Tax=Salix brachista TaxID=2182728 RepID=A0A5N5P3Z4_9ROSI|nr:hypothetical protein DKX38_001122 [Salix brachista]